MTTPRNPNKKRGMISFLRSGENFFGKNTTILRKKAQVVKSRIIVRLIGLSSSNPILMKGKAKAQKIIGKRIRDGKYFFVDAPEQSVNRDIVGEKKEIGYLKPF